MDYLTRNVVVERQKGQTIYSEANPATHLYPDQHSKPQSKPETTC